MIHAALSLLFCLVVAATHGNSSALFLPAIWYAGREFAQAEYRYIAAYCGGKRANMPWYAPFTPDAWTVKGMLDWLLPALVCLGMWALNYYPDTWLKAASGADAAFVVMSAPGGMPWTSLPAD